MKTPLNIGTKEIDASQIAAVRPNTDFDRARLEAATGTAKNFTARIVMLDNTTHNVEELAVPQIVDALAAIGIRFTMIEKDGVAIRNDQSVPVTYHRFGANSEMPEEQRRFFSEARVGKAVKIWLVTPFEDINGAKPAASLQALAAARPGASAANGSKPAHNNG